MTSSPPDTITATPRQSTYPRVLPFAVFMGFIGVEELLRLLVGKGLFHLSEQQFLYLYPVKTLVVILLIARFWRGYDEVRLSDLRVPKDAFTAVLVGVLVFVLWINMDWPFAVIGTLKGYDPTALTEPVTRSLLIGCRIFGAAIVVPIMEELFWRSFLARYLLSAQFWSVSIGRFTVASFTIGSVLFGLEHTMVAAGIMAGIMYNLLLLRSKSIACCILAHGLTNLLLGVYVLAMGAWKFW